MLFLLTLEVTLCALGTPYFVRRMLSLMHYGVLGNCHQSARLEFYQEAGQIWVEMRASDVDLILAVFQMTGGGGQNEFCLDHSAYAKFYERVPVRAAEIESSQELIGV
jgi:hypothetical protein